MKDYNLYKEKLAEIADVSHTLSLLNWDQEVYMPKKGFQRRSQQISTLSGYLHQLSTSSKLEQLVTDLLLKNNLSFEEKRNLEISKKEIDRNKKYSKEFVQQLSQTVSKSFNAWQNAKAAKQFSLFAPHLKELIELKKKECDLLGYEKHPYNAMLDLYEPNCTVNFLDELFLGVKKNLTEITQRIFNAPQNIDNFMRLNYKHKDQWKFSLNLLQHIGYDFDAGRQDLSTHPFTTNFSSNDVRVTTRVNENDLAEIIWSTIHEGGHALYEQGLKDCNYGLPAGTYCSLGIHESQSRLWENNVGRSLDFWKYNYPQLQNIFPQQLKKISVEEFYKAMNIVTPSLVRTNADELTYHFHVMIRYEIEKELFSNNVNINELPEIWNSKYVEYLNINVPSDDVGILQDIHWSHGSFGYFPTYSLGSFYAAQFFNQATKDLPNLETAIANGNTSNLLKWLQSKIHKHGKLFDASTLCKKVTGEELKIKYFSDYVKTKYTKLYRL